MLLSKSDSEFVQVECSAKQNMFCIVSSTLP